MAAIVLLLVCLNIWTVLFVDSQDDFLGNNKYAAFNNITTINFKTSINFTTIVAPSVVKSLHNPLFGQDKPWEPRIDNGYPNVVYTPNSSNKNKTFQLWYDDFINATKPRIEGTLYAESIDGINWVKPNLGIVEFNGTKDNNIMFMKSGGVGVWKDRYTTNKNELYKCFGVLPSAHGTATSPDGIYNWTNFRRLAMDNRYDDHQNMFFDINKSNEYIATTRGPDHPTRVIAIGHSETSLFNSSFTNASVVESGGDYNQTYSQITFKFYNIYLGLVMIFYSNDSNGRVFCELSFSTDLTNWYRIRTDQQIIPLSQLNSNAFDSHICFAAAYPIIYNNKIRLYYFGGNGPHSGKRNSSFGLAQIRLDGFAGITNINNAQNALIESFEITVNGKYFIVNVDVLNNNGNIKIGFKNSNLFSINNCDLINKNVTDYVVSWNDGKNDISSLMGEKIIINFQLFDSILYTFGFVNKTSEI